MKEPVVSLRTYTLTWLALLGLALATTLIGLLNLGAFSMAVAILIATAKAALVVAFFMHGKYESKLVRVIIAAGVVWVLILVQHTRRLHHARLAAGSGEVRGTYGSERRS